MGQLFSHSTNICAASPLCQACAREQGEERCRGLGRPTLGRETLASCLLFSLGMLRACTSHNCLPPEAAGYVLSF